MVHLRDKEFINSEYVNISTHRNILMLSASQFSLDTRNPNTNQTVMVSLSISQARELVREIEDAIQEAEQHGLQ